MCARLRFLRPVVALVGVVVLLAGCALLPVSPRNAPRLLPDAQQVYQPLDVGPKHGDVDSLDPARMLFASDYQKAQLIFPPLLTLDEHNQVAPWAAESWAPSVDGLTWTFHLRAGMRWSDGVPITAETYAYSLNRSLDPCAGLEWPHPLAGMQRELIAGAWALSGAPCPVGATATTATLIGKSINMVDSFTLALTLASPAAYFPMVLASPGAWAQPKQLIARYGKQWTDHLADGGFGGNLFKVSRWDHDGHLDLERNEAFWGAKPRLRAIRWTLYRDDESLWKGYLAGKGDYAGVPVAEMQAASALPGFQARPDLSVIALVPHWRIPPFDDLRVRRAFFLALNRRDVSHRVTHDLMPPTIHLIPQDMPGFNLALKDPAGRDDTPPGNTEAHDLNVLEAAALWKAYLAERFDGDATRVPQVTLCYRADLPGMSASVPFYMEQWRAAMSGLRISASATCEPGAQATRMSRLQLATSVLSPDYPDPQGILSRLARTGSHDNQTGISVPAADALMDAADTNPDTQGRLAHYRAAEQLLIDQVACIPLYLGVNTYVTRPQVSGPYRERARGIAALAVWQHLVMTEAH